jgi:NAD(P)-dependent dehydrogenase (short-subunit alcohol dehydrogenase family)
MQLKDKIALVTGSAHRVGKAIALELAKAGAHVIVHYHRAAAHVPAALAELQAYGVRALALQADLAQTEDIGRLFGAIEAEFGGLDGLVNSASIMAAGEVATLSLADWQRTLDLNLTAPFLCAQHAARMMRARGGGAIVNIADGSALRPWAKYPAHSVSKAGLIMLTQVLARSLAPEIRVNAVAPGPVMKPPDWDAARWARTAQRTLLKHTGSGYDVAQAVRFLIESDFITGETLIVDGGERFA